MNSVVERTSILRTLSFGFLGFFGGQIYIYLKHEINRIHLLQKPSSHLKFEPDLRLIIRTTYFRSLAQRFTFPT